MCCFPRIPHCRWPLEGTGPDMILTCTNVAMKLSGENPYQGCFSVEVAMVSTVHQMIKTRPSTGATNLNERTETMGSLTPN